MKWIDLYRLASIFINSTQEKLTRVYYFSAYASWLREPQKRHRRYVAALQARGVTPVMGYFKERLEECKKCGHRWIGHVEKETDVRIASHLIRGVCRSEFDRVLMISADSDLVPAIEMARSIAPEIPITLVLPPGRRNHADSLRKVASSTCHIKINHLERSLLPDKIITVSGKRIVRPPEYDP
ncbi:MAG: NYN domain-containing protein [Nitrospinota bacterium]